jgi:hypothetical protein
MRINSNKAYALTRYLYLLVAVLFLVDLILLNIEGQLKDLSGLSVLAVGMLAFFVYRGYPVFEYDSDGEVLIFSNYEPILKGFSKRFSKHTEFPKRKLAGYRFVYWPFKTKLIIHIHSRDNSVRKMDFAVSSLNKMEIRGLDRSLAAVLKQYQTNPDGERADERTFESLA